MPHRVRHFREVSPKLLLRDLSVRKSRLTIIPTIPGMGATRFLDELAALVPSERVRVCTALHWEKDTPGALFAQLDNAVEHPVWLIHHLDQSDEDSLRAIIEKVIRGSALVIATVTTDRLNELADEIITLTPMTLAETEQLAFRLTGCQLPAIIVEAIHSATGGRPDYTVEIIDSAPRDHWLHDNPTLLLPDSWYIQYEHATKELSDQTREALRARPLAIRQLTEAIEAGLIDVTVSANGRVATFRDPRYQAVSNIEMPKSATDPVSLERTLLAKAQQRARHLDLPSTQLYLRDCTGNVDVDKRDSLAGFVALFSGHRNHARTLLKKQTNSAEQSVRATLMELADWQPNEVIKRAKHVQSIVLPGTEAYEEAEALTLMAKAIINGKRPTKLPDFGHGISRQRLQLFLGWIALAHDDPATAIEYLRPIPGGSPSIGLWQDALLARTLYVTGQWREAKAIVERGLASCAVHGVQLLEPMLLWTGSQIAAMEGDEALADHYLSRSTTASDAFLIQKLPAAMGRMAVTASVGDLTNALRAGSDLARAVAHTDTQHPGYWPWEDLYAQTLLRAGRIDEADEIVTSAEARCANSNIQSLQAKNAVPRATIVMQRGDTKKAFSLFDDAVSALEHSPMSAYTARVLFEYGLILRRVGRRSQADDILQRAGDLFAEMGATAMLQRCDRERRAGGVGGRAYSSHGLTPQEEQVARLVADGATNRDVARELTLSTKTVEYHLTHVYKKLKISGRHEIISALQD